jgi:hypothetical protein
MDNLIKEMLRTEELKEIRSFDDGFGRTKEYGIETDDYLLTVWNSSNHREFNHQEAIKEIIPHLLDFEFDGSYSDGYWNEIMWEVIEK